MVTVHHEVGIPDLVEFDRRQVLPPLERPVYALPLVPHARPRGQEGSIKVPPSRRLLATSSLLTSSKESNRFDTCSLRIRATSARRRARRLARVKSASTCSFRSMYGIIFQPSQNRV